MRLIGTGDFYKKIMKVAVPIMIQNGITNFVSMLDNIMVGRVGTDAMSGVSIVNQLFFVYVLCLFGATAGIGIFTAQFSGKGDNEGVKYTMRIKLAVSLVLALIWTAVFVFFVPHQNKQHPISGTATKTGSAIFRRRHVGGRRILRDSGPNVLLSRESL